MFYDLTELTRRTKTVFLVSPCSVWEGLESEIHHGAVFGVCELEDGGFLSFFFFFFSLLMCECILIYGLKASDLFHWYHQMGYLFTFAMIW